MTTTAIVERPEHARAARRNDAARRVELRNVSRWYGNVVAVNDVSFTLGPGITGLLGPNGAGKTTILHMMAGLLRPSVGDVLDRRAAPRRAVPTSIAGSRSCRSARPCTRFSPGTSSCACARGCSSCRTPTRPRARPIALVDLDRRAAPQDRHVLEGHAPAHQDRRRARARPDAAAARRAVQRDGSAAAPPDDGPAARARRREGRVIVISSHILEELDDLATNVLVMVAGRLAASGHFREIRRLMTDRPHTFTIRSSDDRRLAAALLGDASGVRRRAHARRESSCARRIAAR